MHLPAPFALDTARPYCPAAWQGPAHGFVPEWRRYRSLNAISTGGLYELLRRAQLPRVELVYMGAAPALLEGLSPVWVGCEWAEPLLGRIALDAQEVVWSPHLRPVAVGIGAAVIEAAFQ